MCNSAGLVTNVDLVYSGLVWFGLVWFGSGATDSRVDSATAARDQKDRCGGDVCALTSVAQCQSQCLTTSGSIATTRNLPARGVAVVVTNNHGYGGDSS